MPLFYRVCRSTRAVFDGTGAYVAGGRWNSPGRAVIYGATCLAGSLLEIVVQAGPRAKLPGSHHCARALIPDDLAIEVLDEAELPGWEAVDSASAREFGDQWLEESRTPVLSVPAATSKPFGRNLLLNPSHPHYNRIQLEPPVSVRWDVRLFRT